MVQHFDIIAIGMEVHNTLSDAAKRGCWTSSQPAATLPLLLHWLGCPQRARFACAPFSFFHLTFAANPVLLFARASPEILHFVFYGTLLPLRKTLTAIAIARWPIHEDMTDFLSKPTTCLVTNWKIDLYRRHCAHHFFQ